MVGTFVLVSAWEETSSYPQKRSPADLKSAQSGFESQWGHRERAGRGVIGANGSARGPAHRGVVAPRAGTTADARSA
jgi:hypothetical protein